MICKNLLLCTSKEILYICVEHYFGTENFIRKYGMAHLNEHRL